MLGLEVGDKRNQRWIVLSKIIKINHCACLPSKRTNLGAPASSHLRTFVLFDASYNLFDSAKQNLQRAGIRCSEAINAWTQKTPIVWKFAIWSEFKQIIMFRSDPFSFDWNYRLQKEKMSPFSPATALFSACKMETEGYSQRSPGNFVRSLPPPWYIAKKKNSSRDFFCYIRTDLEKVSPGILFLPQEGPFHPTSVSLGVHSYPLV